jgi:hypothetical protein
MQATPTHLRLHSSERRALAVPYWRQHFVSEPYLPFAFTDCEHFIHLISFLKSRLSQDAEPIIPRGLRAIMPPVAGEFKRWASSVPGNPSACVADVRIPVPATGIETRCCSHASTNTRPPSACVPASNGRVPSQSPRFVPLGVQHRRPLSLSPNQSVRFRHNAICGLSPRSGRLLSVVSFQPFLERHAQPSVAADAVKRGEFSHAPSRGAAELHVRCSMSLVSFLREMPRERWIQFAWKSGFIAYVSGGFVAGAFLCKDCDGNPIGYILVSIVIGILSLLTFGFPPKTEMLTSTQN